MNDQFVLGVDIGGSHITTGLVDMQKKRFIEGSAQRSRVDSHGPAGSILDGWTATIRLVLEAATTAVTKIGIAMPGPFDYEHGISLMKDDHKFGSLYKMNVRKELAKRLGLQAADIRFRNDAEAFLDGEVFGGAAAGCSFVVGLTLGTGLGSAIHQNGRTIDAQWWCAPFEGSIAEDRLSTRWFLQRYWELTGQTVINVKELAAKVGMENKAQQVFDEFGLTLGQFLDHFVDEGVDCVVIGGNVANALPLFKTTLQAYVRPSLFNMLKQSTLGEMAALVGSASLWQQMDPSSI